MCKPQAFRCRENSTLLQACRVVRQIQSLMVIQCDNCPKTIPCCAACNETWVKRANGWTLFSKRSKWACRDCCDSWGDAYSLEKCRIEYSLETCRAWVCAKCCSELPDSLTTASSDTQPPTVTISESSGGGGAGQSSSFADTTIVAPRPERQDKSTSVSGDFFEKHAPQCQYHTHDSNVWNSNDNWWCSDEWQCQRHDYSHK